MFISAGCKLNQLILEEEVPNAAHEPPVEVGFGSCGDGQEWPRHLKLVTCDAWWLHGESNSGQIQRSIYDILTTSKGT